MGPTYNIITDQFSQKNATLDGVQHQVLLIWQSDDTIHESMNIPKFRSDDSSFMGPLCNTLLKNDSWSWFVAFTKLYLALQNLFVKKVALYFFPFPYSPVLSPLQPTMNPYHIENLKSIEKNGTSHL